MKIKNILSFILIGTAPHYRQYDNEKNTDCNFE